MTLFTSRLAAESIKPTASTLRAKVYAYIRDSGGATDDEVQVGLNMNPSTQRPRRVELVEACLVRASAVRRKTRSGREAVVWEVVK